MAYFVNNAPEPYWNYYGSQTQAGVAPGTAATSWPSEAVRVDCEDPNPSPETTPKYVLSVKVLSPTNKRDSTIFTLRDIPVDKALESLGSLKK